MEFGFMYGRITWTIGTEKKRKLEAFEMRGVEKRLRLNGQNNNRRITEQNKAKTRTFARCKSQKEHYDRAFTTS